MSHAINESLMSARQTVIAYIDTLNPDTCHPDLYKMRDLVRNKIQTADADRLDRIASAIRLMGRLPACNPFRN